MEEFALRIVGVTLDDNWAQLRLNCPPADPGRIEPNIAWERITPAPGPSLPYVPVKSPWLMTLETTCDRDMTWPVTLDGTVKETLSPPVPASKFSMAKKV